MINRLIILTSIFILFTLLVLAQHISIRNETTFHYKTWMGTGFFITNNGYIATANHVVAGSSGLTVEYQNYIYNANIIAQDETHDIAIIKINVNNTKFFPLHSLGSCGIAILGYPDPIHYGWNLKKSKGWDEYKNYSSTYLYYHANTCPGNSGSPVISNYGNVVGLVNVGYTETDYNKYKCSRVGGGQSSYYLIILADEYKIPVNTSYVLQYKSFNYWFNYYKDSVVVIHAGI